MEETIHCGLDAIYKKMTKIMDANFIDNKKMKYVSIYADIKDRDNESREFAAKIETDVTNIEQVNHHINDLLSSLMRTLKKREICNIFNKIEVIIDDPIH